MKRLYSLVLVGISFSALAKLDTSSPIFKIEDGKAVPYYGKSAIDPKHRQLGSIQINPSAAGITISRPGVYILADNITGNGSTTTGLIRITTDNVDLDLNGFFVSNPVGPGGAGGPGVHVVGGIGIKNIAVRNGTVRACTNNGVQVEAVTNLIIDSILATDNMGNGIDIDGNTGAISNTLINNCRAQNNANGFAIGTTGTTSTHEFRQCQATDNTAVGFSFTGTSFTFESCFSVGNTLHGFHGTDVFEIVMRECQSKNNSGVGMFFDTAGPAGRRALQNATIENCEALNNGSSGISCLDAPADVLVKNCTVNSNTGEGIVFGSGILGAATNSSRITLEDNAANRNSSANIFIVGDNCIINNNESIGSLTSDGIRVLGTVNVIRDNVASSQEGSGDGIQLLTGSDQCVVTGNTCSSNGDVGILILASADCVIEGNVCSKNGTGIATTAAGTYAVFGNLCVYNTDNYALAGTFIQSPITGAINASTTSTTSKWDNVTSDAT